MPTIDVSNDTLKQLSDLAEPFVDTKPEDVIKKLIKLKLASIDPVKDDESAPTFSALTPPDLSHTKILSAKINGREMVRPNWNRIMDRVIVLAADKLNDVDALDKLILANHVKGPRTDSGYDYFPQAGVSVQGQDSNNAWKTAAYLIKELGFKAEVTFTWYDTPKALNPGIVGKLTLE